MFGRLSIILFFIAISGFGLTYLGAAHDFGNRPGIVAILPVAFFVAGAFVVAGFFVAIGGLVKDYSKWFASLGLVLNAAASLLWMAMLALAILWNSGNPHDMH